MPDGWEVKSLQELQDRQLEWDLETIAIYGDGALKGEKIAPRWSNGGLPKPVRDMA